MKQIPCKCFLFCSRMVFAKVFLFFDIPFLSCLVMYSCLFSIMYSRLFACIKTKRTFQPTEVFSFYSTELSHCLWKHGTCENKISNGTIHASVRTKQGQYNIIFQKHCASEPYLRPCKHLLWRDPLSGKLVG